MTRARLTPSVHQAFSRAGPPTVRRVARFLIVALAAFCLTPRVASANDPQGSHTLPTPLQHEINVQAERLSSTDIEQRRDAVMRLRALERPEASRAAAVALGDASPLVRASAAHAVTALERDEAASLVLPLLRDRDEFVRREAGYALGRTRSTLAIQPLVAALEADRSGAVRGAAAVALGMIADPVAAPALANSLSRRIPAPGYASRGGRRRPETDEFVRRAAAIALGQIGERQAGLTLTVALQDDRNPDDLRREAAHALGRIGDPAAVPALRAALSSRDPHLARVSFDALRHIERSSRAPAN